LGRPGAPALTLGIGAGPGRVGVEPVQQPVEGGQRVDQRQLLAHGRSRRETLEIPRDVLADVAAAAVDSSS
jgi:hypothetical protein